MRGKHTRKAPKFRVFRAATAFVLAIVFCVLSFSTVMANTVSANVIDGDKSYTFSMDSNDLDRILAQAELQGLQALGPLDVAEQVPDTTTVNIRRGVPMTVSVNGQQTHLVGYLGDTVDRTLARNNIVVKAGDVLTPAGDTPVSAGLTVTVSREYQVKVTADGETASVTLTGGTVEDALKQAGVRLGAEDTVNYDGETAVTDHMNIRVSRAVTIAVIDRGERTEARLSAGSVRAALKKLGIQVSEDDQLNVELGEKLTQGMEIVITRVETELVTETEDVEYITEYIDSDELYEGQEEVLTPGQLGLRQRTYKLLTQDGELVGKELVSEEIVEDPVAEVILRGTQEREEPQEEESQDHASSNESGNVGEIHYVDKLVGECTAYYPTYEGCGTATGVPAGYGCVAVNPYVIPYGSLLYITSPDGSIVYGYGTAVDTGGACMAGDILADLCYDTEAECSIIGRRDMVIYVIRYGY